MKKTTAKPTAKKAVKTATTPKANKVDLTKLTRPELVSRYKANVAERKQLSEKQKPLVEAYKANAEKRKKLSDENKILVDLYKKLSTRKPKTKVKPTAKAKKPVKK